MSDLDGIRREVLAAVTRLPQPTLGLAGGVNRGAVVDAINDVFRQAEAVRDDEPVRLPSVEALHAAIQATRTTIYRCDGDPERCTHPYHSSDRTAEWEQAEDAIVASLDANDRRWAERILAALPDEPVGGPLEEDVRILFDAVIGSLDFGSGFLDREDIEALGRVADALGIDRKANDLPEAE